MSSDRDVSVLYRLPLLEILNRRLRDKSARQRDTYNLKYVSNPVTVLIIT